MQPNVNVNAVLALANALRQFQLQKAASIAPSASRNTDVDADEDQDDETDEGECSYAVEPLPLLVNSCCPPNMNRHEWSLQDYVFKHSTDRIPGGTLSEVYRAKCRVSGQKVIVKVTDLDGDYCEEAEIHTSLHHPHIIQCHAAWQETSEEGIEQLVMVMELAEGGDLANLLRDPVRCPRGLLDEEEAVNLVILPLLKALSHIHSKGIIHRDIKLENILFATTNDNNNKTTSAKGGLTLKLCNFGISKQLTRGEGSSAFTPGCGTMAFIAREVFEVDPVEGYGCSADIWSLGVLAFRILSGSCLFEGQGDELKRNIVEGKRAELPLTLSSLARSFVSDATHRDPSERPDAFELMSHPWIKAHQMTGGGAKDASYSDLMSEGIRKLII